MKALKFATILPWLLLAAGAVWAATQYAQLLSLDTSTAMVSLTLRRNFPAIITALNFSQFAWSRGGWAA